MPPRPPLANTVKLAILWQTVEATTAANILHCLMGSGWTPTQPNLLAVAQNVGTALTAGTPSLLSKISGSCWTTQINAYDNGGTTENEASYVHQYTGGDPSGILPPNVAMCLSWTIPAHYRGGHPRTYLPGVPTDAVAAQGSPSLTTTFRSALASAAGNFLTSFLGSLAAGVGEQLGSMAFSRSNVALATPVFYPFSGGYVHGRLDSQRRRLGKESAYP